MSKSSKIVLAVVAVLIITLFYMMWKGLGGEPTIAPRAPL